MRDVGAGFAGPAVVGDRLILFHRVNNRETVEAIETTTGKTIWTFDYSTSYRDDFGFDEGPRAVPVISGGRVFTHGADGWLHGIDFATGKMLWSVDTRKVFDAPKGFFGVASSPVVD
ncbi:MAG: PQQ-binding-like beta-propeller repeat protein, partial [Acidobacteriota bacterium]